MPDTRDRIKNIEKYYNPVKAIRYHFTEFNVWMGFFVAINGSLLLAFSSENFILNEAAGKLIPLLGYIASLIFYCVSIVYSFSISYLSKIIEKDFDATCYALYSRPLKYTKKFTITIAIIISSVLSFAWLYVFCKDHYNIIIPMGFNVVLLFLLFLLLLVNIWIPIKFFQARN